MKSASIPLFFTNRRFSEYRERIVFHLRIYIYNEKESRVRARKQISNVCRKLVVDFSFGLCMHVSANVKRMNVERMSE